MLVARISGRATGMAAAIPGDPRALLCQFLRCSAIMIQLKIEEEENKLFRVSPVNYSSIFLTLKYILLVMGDAQADNQFYC